MSEWVSERGGGREGGREGGPSVRRSDLDWILSSVGAGGGGGVVIYYGPTAINSHYVKSKFYGILSYCINCFLK